MLNASELKIKSKDDEKEWNPVQMRSCRVVKPLVLNIKEYSSARVEGELSRIHQYYYAQLWKLDEDETKNIEIAVVGTRLCGRFNQTSKLKVMKFKEAMNKPNSNKWKEENKNEQTRMREHWLVRRKAMVPTMVD